VSDLYEANTGTANDPDGPYPDQGFVDLLTGAGHTVTRYNPPDAGALPAADIANLNAADLVILGRGIGSGAFDATAETVVWNTLITQPLISTNSYLSRQSRLGWFTGSTLPDTAANTASVTWSFLNPADPVAAYIIGGTAMAGSSTANPMFVDVTPMLGAGTSQGVSVITNAPVAGGAVLAQTSFPVGGYEIVTFPSGTNLAAGGGPSDGQILSGYRMHFSAGNREPASPNNQLGRAGWEDLTPEAEQMFLRAVDVAINNGLPIPEPGTAALAGFAGVVLLRRRRR
jgi:hypothetical protein